MFFQAKTIKIHEKAKCNCPQSEMRERENLKRGRWNGTLGTPQWLSREGAPIELPCGASEIIAENSHNMGCRASSSQIYVNLGKCWSQNDEGQSQLCRWFTIHEPWT
jgi:hypothetical protein